MIKLPECAAASCCAVGADSSASSTSQSRATSGQSAAGLEFDCIEDNSFADSSDAGSIAEDSKPVNIYESANVGFLAQYFVVGLIYGGLPATTYGVLAVYLNTPGYIYGAAEGMATLPWSFKAFYGALHDVVPIGGYRRKPYMVIGWALCTLALLALASGGLPEPYWCTDDDGIYVTTCDEAHRGHSACAGKPFATDPATGQLKAAAAEPCNAAAADAGGPVAILMFVACLGYVCADVAADGLTVSYAQREPLEIRGRVQSTVYLVRSIGFIFSYFIVGFGMNGRKYGGSFEVGLSFEAVCATFALPCLAMVFLSWFRVKEPTLVARPALRTYLRGTWGLLCSRFFFSVVVFSFVFSGLGSIVTPANISIQRYWAKVQNMQKQLSRIVSQAVFAGGLALTRRYLLNYSWRKLLVITAVSTTLIDICFTWPTVFDLFRNQYFFLGEAFLTELPAAIQFVVTTFVVVEAASKDNGGLVYGLLTTAHNIGLSFARPMANQLFGTFRPSLSDSANFIEDTPSFRSLVMVSVFVSYGFTLLALGVLPLLPDQKSEAQERKRTWSSSPRIGYLSLGLLGSTFLYSVTLTFLAMFPATACLQIVGGEGC